MSTLTANPKLRATMKAHKIPVWRLAQAAGVHVNTLGAWLRFDLEGDRLARVQAALAQLTGEEV